MYRFFWSLPGPSHYLEQVQSDLEEGKMVFLLFPKTFPWEGIQQIKILLRERLTDRHWCNLNLAGKEKKPVEAMRLHLIPRRDKYIPNEIIHIIQEEALSGLIAWVNHLPSINCWKDWVSFFEEYQHSLQHYPSYSRPLFCLPIQDERAKELPEVDTCLSHFKFSNILGRLDLQLLTSWILRNKQGNDLRKRVLTAVISEVTGVDINLCHDLCQLTPAEVFQPHDFLKNYYTGHHWHPQFNEKLDDFTKWLNGLEFLIDDKTYTHSVQLTLNGDSGSIEKRVWRGQVGVLFPIVEEIRQEIIRKLSSILEVPHKRLTGDIINEKINLELGDIVYQLNGKKKRLINPNLLKLISTAKRIRDKLAHFQGVELSLIETPEFQNYEEVIRNGIR